MDIQFWIWVIVVTIMVISRFRKKVAEPVETEVEDLPSTPADRGPGRPLTFEELLKEIQSSKEPAPPARRVIAAPAQQPVTQSPKPAPGWVDYDEDIKDEEDDLEAVEVGPASTPMYERAKAEAFSRPSLEETMKLEDTDVRFGHFKAYEGSQQSGLAEEIKESLKNPDGLRKAFIMSEILNRKF